jgi:trehalose-phosphatase
VAVVLALQPSAVVLDYGGTIIEEAGRRQARQLVAGVRDKLSDLAQAVDRLVIVGSRPAGEMAATIDIPTALYIGRQGLDRIADQHEVRLALQPAAAEAFEHACAALRPYLRVMNGVDVDHDRGHSLTIHYEGAPLPRWTRGQILRLVQPLTGRGITIQEGRRLVELWPAGTPGKAGVVEGLVQTERLRGLVYCGDDRRDLDTFHALARLRQEREVACLSLAVLGRDTAAEVPEAADASVGGADQLMEVLHAAATLVASPTWQH